MVRPAKTPPLRTRAAATDRYSHIPGSPGDSGASVEWERGEIGVGAAFAIGSWWKRRTKILTRPSMTGWVVIKRFIGGAAITVGEGAKAYWSDISLGRTEERRTVDDVTDRGWQSQQVVEWESWALRWGKEVKSWRYKRVRIKTRWCRA